MRLAKPEGSDEVEHSYRGAAGSCTVPAATDGGPLLELDSPERLSGRIHV